MDDLVNKIKKYLYEDKNILIALLYGSYAKKCSKPDSDIDIAIAYSKEFTIEKRIKIAQDLSRITNKEVDLVDFKLAKGVLLQQILANRLTIINRDSELYGNIFSKHLMEEEDYMPLYSKLLKARREKFLSSEKNG